MQELLAEFRKFIMRGNVLDLAVGIIMPPVGWILGGVDFSRITLRLNDNVGIGIGAFINTLINFVVIAFAVFMIIRAVNRLSAQKEAEPAAPPPPDPALETQKQLIEAMERLTKALEQRK